MIITVRLYATLRDMVPEGRKALQVEVPDGTTVAELVHRMGIPDGIVRKAFVGGIARDDEYALHPGDEVGIFPPIAGGAHRSATRCVTTDDRSALCPRLAS